MIIKFIKKFNKKLIKNKKNILSIFFVCIFFVFFIVNPVSADVGGAVATVLGWIASLLTSVIGYFLTFLIKILVNVANFNNIIDVPAVKNGWVIVRDLCNMFFILILLVIAFAAILRIESYNLKKTLPKLLIMAVLINFSKTIFGLIIDFSQVVMLTFVGGFGGENAGSFLVNAFQIQRMGAITDSPGVEVSGWATSVAIILGVIAMLIAFVVVAVMLAVLIMRVMMLWIYTILSPLVFLGFAFPPIQKYVGRIWEDFIKQVIVGPMLAFFLWLALTTAGDSSNKISSITAPTGASEGVTGGVNALFQEGNFQTFIIVIGMLIGGLMVTQQIGGMAGAAAGKGMGAIRKGVVGGAWGATKMGADWINRKQAEGFKVGKYRIAGIDLNPFRQVARIKEGLERGKVKDLSKMEEVAGARLRKGGMTGAIGGFTAKGWTDQHVRGLLGYRGFKSAIWGGEKKVERLRGEENEARWRSRHVFADQGEFDQKKQEYLQKAQEAREYGNIDEYKKKMEDVKKMRDLGGELIVEEKKERQDKKSSFLKEAEKKAKGAAEYTVVDYEGMKARRSAENEEASKITSTNEDELVAQFDVALSRKNTPLAGALARRIAQIGGFNALLNKYGHQATAGLNEAEAKELKDAGREDEITEKRGLNDFMRNIFEKRLGMDRQNTLALQSDIGGIGQQINHEYLIKTVGVDKIGKFYQSDQDSRTLNINVEKSKMDREGVIRKGNRLNYGAEDLTTGKFKWSASGLTEFVNNWKIIGKEIKGARLNRSTAARITEPEALKTLEKVMKKAEKQGVLGEGFEDTKTVDEFIEKLKTYAKSSGEEGVKEIGKVIKDELKEGDQDRIN